MHLCPSVVARNPCRYGLIRSVVGLALGEQIVACSVLCPVTRNLARLPPAHVASFAQTRMQLLTINLYYALATSSSSNLVWRGDRNLVLNLISLSGIQWIPSYQA